MKRIVSIAAALALGLTCVTASAEGFTPASSYDEGERTFNGGKITMEAAPAGGGEVTTDVYAGEAGKDYTDEKVYTYRVAIGGTTDMKWSPHTWETNEDNQIVSYVTDGFYMFRLNSDKTGYSVQTAMAAEFPVDVTADYVGKYGVKEGESAKAWRIALNPDACFDQKDENGEYAKITADDYIYSMQQQLNPKMLNRRADSYYAGDFIIHNAKQYLYAGKTTYDALTVSADEAVAAGETVYVDMWGLWGLEGATTDDGAACPQYVAIDDDTMYRDAAVEDATAEEAYVSGKYLYENYLAAGQAYESQQGTYLFTKTTNGDTSWDEVGLVKVDDYTIDVILDKPVSEPAFYMPYNLSSNWLVYKPMYESCKRFFDADGKEVATEEEAATVTTNYCTSVETSVSYGPYSLTYFELDKQYTMSRNESWYGYHDGKHLGMYQTDVISSEVIAEHATELLAFESGEIDEVALASADMEKYASSAYIKYEPQTYTTKVTFNTDYAKLLSHGTNSQLLAVKEFREAFALSLDRNHFATAYTAAGTAGFGLLNYMYVYDPFTGAAYRNTDAAKAALCDIYGTTYGEGGQYDTLDEAYEAITGYDMAKAQELMQTAYDKAVAAGIYDGESEVKIDFRVYQNDTVYVQMFNYFDGQLKEACKGTSFEGKVSMTMTVDADYYNTMNSGNADAIFTTWGGAPMGPFGVLGNCYTDASDGSGNQNEYGFDTSKIAVTFNMNDEDVTASLQDWANWANSQDVEDITSKVGNYNDYSYATRSAIFAGLEECYLSYYVTTPMYYRNVASLTSQKMNVATTDYVQLVAFGGVEYITYNYDDAAWADYIANNTLVY